MSGDSFHDDEARVSKAEAIRREILEAKELGRKEQDAQGEPAPSEQVGKQPAVKIALRPRQAPMSPETQRRPAPGTGTIDVLGSYVTLSIGGAIVSRTIVYYRKTLPLLSRLY